MKQATKNLLKIMGTLGMTAAIAIPMAACGPMAPDDDAPYTPPEVWHEDVVDNITMFCNDWEQFNNAASVRSPVYKELVKAAGTELKAKSTGLETYYTQLDLMRVNQQLPEMFIIDGPTNPELYRGLIRDGEIIPITYYVNEENKDDYPYLYEYLQQFSYMKTNLTYAKNEIWFVPVKWSNDKSLYVRRDWIRNLNN